MRKLASTGQLSARDREVLNDVVRTFILTGEPVSSRSVAKHEQHGISAATIRNTMADLEDDGFLIQHQVHDQMSAIQPLGVIGLLQRQTEGIAEAGHQRNHALILHSRGPEDSE